MKINRMAEENMFPSWALKNEKADQIEQARQVLSRELKHFNTASCNCGGPTDSDIACECDRIDQCATSGETYYYPTDWDKDCTDHLKEYAKIAGLNSAKVVGLNTNAVLEALAELENEDELVEASKETQKQAMEVEKMTKVASGNNEETSEIDPSDFRFDPFRLQEIMTKEEDTPDVWQTISKQQNLSDKPIMESGVRPIRGGEDTSVSNQPSLAANQNSIDNPDAIQQMAESEIADTGARLAAEKAAKEQAKKDNHAQWEQEKIEAMSKSDIVPKGRVFPTESLNAQPGIRDSVVAAHSSFDPNDLPEKTAGELLKEKNTARKESIQRETADDKAWDSVQSQSSFGVSDSFAESLKQQLNK